MIHFVEYLSFPPNPAVDSSVICGYSGKDSVTNAISFVDCPKCLSMVNNRRCCICGTVVKLDEISDNEFYIGCAMHKAKAQKMTEVFFKKNSNYKLWQHGN